MSKNGKPGRTLFERAGGEPAIMAAVDLFYKKVLADDVTRPFFAGLDMDAQVKKQVAFMCWALGGPEEYKGRPLREAHADLVKKKGLGQVHFDAVAKHLRAALAEMGLAGDVIADAMAIVAGARSEVLGG